MFSLTGKVDFIGQPEQITDNFSKRDLVLFIPNDKNPNYPNHVLLQASNAKMELLNTVQQGQDVEVGFFINGRRIQTKDGRSMVINNLSINSLTVSGQTQQPPQQQPQNTGNGYNPQAQQGYTQNNAGQGVNPSTGGVNNDQGNDDLPF